MANPVFNPSHPQGILLPKEERSNFNGVDTVREAGGGERRRAARWKPSDPKIAHSGLSGFGVFSDEKEKPRNKVGSREGLQGTRSFSDVPGLLGKEQLAKLD